MIELSEKTKEVLEALFPEESREQAKLLLEKECGDNIPDCEKSNKCQMERIRFAALKLSDGNIEKLYDAVSLAQIDWRDLLMAAGFGEDIEAHEKWIV